jgi:general secretion pathway protein C
MLATVTRLLSGNSDGLARFAIPVNIVFILLLAEGLAQLSWNFLLSPAAFIAATGESIDRKQPSASSPDRHGMPASTLERSADYLTIANWHLFGQLETAKPVQSPPVKAPETKLNLQLVGTFASEDDVQALALITESNGSARAYKVGELVPGGARLEQILTDRIVLSRNGHLEILSLPREFANTDRAFSSNTLAASLSPPMPSNATTVDASTVAARLRNTIGSQPEKTLQDLALATPYIEDGQFLGFRLLPGRDQQLLRELGLRTGDIITQVNGVRLDNPGQGINLLQELLDADQVAIQVQRAGTEIPFTFILNAQ